MSLQASPYITLKQLIPADQKIVVITDLIVNEMKRLVRNLYGSLA